MVQPGHLLIAEPTSRVSSWRDAVARALTNEGHTVEVVASAAEVITALQRRPVDVAIIDADLDAAALLGHAARGHTRIILNAGEFDNETVVAALRAHVHSLVTTSSSVTDVLWTVHEAVVNQNGKLPAIEVVSAREAWLEVLAPCSLPTEERLLSFLTRLHPDVSEDVRDALNHALRELLTNAIEWGGRLDPERYVRVTCVRGARLILCRILDPGPGFRLDALPHAAVNNPIDRPLDHALVREEKKIRPGGFGISLVRGMVDELTYNEAHNEVIFVKYLPSPQ